MATKTYPECEKLKAVKDKSQTIGEFLEWLEAKKNVFLADEGAYDEHPVRFQYHIEELLAEYFEIDLKKVETEQRIMLKKLQNGG